ncbi:MAG: hypothetical protein O7D34_01545 [Ignavibacteria bacterium]|nr:hypothetical protein [Ignavibacteria bacterium]
MVQSGEDETIVVAWWNLENLFDTTNDVDRLLQFGSDDEFTPQGTKERTLNRYEQKLRNVASVISLMNDGEGPDILGVCEVEHEHVLRELARRYLADMNYEVVYHESPDARGIDVSFISIRPTFLSFFRGATGRSPFQPMDHRRVISSLPNSSVNQADLFALAIIGLLEEAALKNLNRGGSSLQRSVELWWILFFTAHHQKISLLRVTLMTTQRISL